MAADKDGFATSHKNATLQELLRQITHPNAKVRKSTFLLLFFFMFHYTFFMVEQNMDQLFFLVCGN